MLVGYVDYLNEYNFSRQTRHINVFHVSRYFSTSLANRNTKFSSASFKLTGLHHTVIKNNKTFFFLLKEYSNKLCCPDIQNIHVVFTAKVNPISERLELMDFMGIT